MSTALVLGGGDTVWDDIEAALDLGQYQAVVACNDVASVWPGRLDAVASLHVMSWGKWIARRDAQGLPRPSRILGHEGAQKTHSHLPDCVTGFTDHRFPGQTASGSSGLFALKVALVDLGHDRAVLCGVPMLEANGHFFNPSEWRGAKAHRRGWLEAMPMIRDRARSMSGWTAEQLGQPTSEWVAGQ